ncbi:adhesion G-protein coupled receptor D1-like isoform X2 [Rhopilema esculentum]|uniref:adhesion G-protein coupled receptor D1-like isoform X2 n=1 Tax=Rhopilema esculentum TaxID=499914 RepID=UPI0031E49551
MAVKTFLVAMNFLLYVYGENLPEGLVIKTTTTRSPTTLPTTTKTITIKKSTVKSTQLTSTKRTSSTEDVATSGMAKAKISTTLTPRTYKRTGRNLDRFLTIIPINLTKAKGRKDKKKKKESQSAKQFRMLKRSRKKRIRLEEKSYMKEFLRNCSMLLRSIKEEKRERKRRRNNTVTFGEEEEPPNSYEIVQTLNSFGTDLAYSLGQERARNKKKKEVLPVSVDEIDMEVSVVSTEQFTGYVFPDPSSNLSVSESIKLPSGIFKDTATGNGTIISIVYNALFEMTDQNSTGSLSGATVNSKVLSTTVYPPPTGILKEPVEIVLTHLQKPNSTTPECVFWRVNQSNPSEGEWSTEGCVVAKSNSSHTVCRCNHLTDFAVLFRVSKTKKISVEHRQALQIVSLVGCFISAVCLLITVLVFLILRKLLRSTRNLIHLNLAVGLLFANLLFMISGKVVSSKYACLAVSISLFYFFLAAFFLMLGEGIYIWIMVAKAFSQNLKAWMYMLIGWGLPLVIVGVSFGIFRLNMVAENFCWLSVQSGAIWAFVGPVILVISVNLCIIVKALCTAVEHHSDGHSLKVSGRLALVLMPILGLTWLFGIFTMNEQTVVFEYLFTIFNSLQGFFIFVCYIILNREVKTEYQKMKTQKLYSLSLQAKSSQSTTETRLRRSRAGTQEEEHIELAS